MPDPNTVFQALYTGSTEAKVFDVMFPDGVNPVAILGWDGPPDSLRPLGSVPLDKARLTPSGRSDIEYLYSGPLPAGLAKP